MNSLQDFANKAEWEGGIYGGMFEYTGSDASTDDPDFNALWKKAHAAIDAVCAYLVNRNIVSQEGDDDNDDDTDYDDDDGFDFDNDDDEVTKDDFTALNHYPDDDSAL